MVARQRQHYVLRRMVDSGFITLDESKKALVKPLQIAGPKRQSPTGINYFTEEVRSQAEARFGHDLVYKEGLIIQTTLDARAQRIAEKALDQGLRELDKRNHTYRALRMKVPTDEWPSALRILGQFNGELEDGKIVAGLVTDFEVRSKTCDLNLGTEKALITQSGWQWTHISEKRAEEIFHTGDVLRVKLRAAGRQDMDSFTRAGPGHGRGAHEHFPVHRPGDLHGGGRNSKRASSTGAHRRSGSLVLRSSQ